MSLELRVQMNLQHFSKPLVLGWQISNREEGPFDVSRHIELDLERRRE